MSIKAIDVSSIHRLTSGQVIIDLQTAVKELVENSLDANSTSIEVRFKNYGLNSVEVIDNGYGIREDDYESIALKHHTSKLNRYSDLASVQTFGFRGEALSSLCALSSSLTIVTATAEQAPMATVLEFSRDGRLKDSRTKMARNKGTTTLLSGLFTPLPVRRKEFERNVKREFAKALAILHAYALVPCTRENNGVRLVVTNQLDKGPRSIQLRTDGTSSLKASVLGLWGPKSLDNIVPLNLAFTVVVNRSAALIKHGLEKDIISVEVQGLVSQFSSGCGRPSADRQFFFVNGRPCSLNRIQKIMNEIYRSFNSGQAPFLIADFRLPTEAYDINVSPDKRTIFLHNEDALIQALKESVEETFSSSRSTYTVNHTTPSSVPRVEQSDLPSTSNASSSSLHTPKNLDKPITVQSPPLNVDESMFIEPTNAPLSKRKDNSIPKQDRGYSAVTLDNFKNSGDRVKMRTTSTDDSNSVVPDEPPKKRLKVDKAISDQLVLNTKEASWNLRGNGRTQSGRLGSENTGCVQPSIDMQPSKPSNIHTDEKETGSSHIRKMRRVSSLSSLLDDDIDSIQGKGLQDDDALQVQSPKDGRVSSIEPTIESGSNLEAPESMSSLSKSISSPSIEVVRTLVSNANLKLNMHRLQNTWRLLRLKARVHDVSPRMSGRLEKHAGIDNDIKEAEEELNRVIHKEDFGCMQIMGQFNLGFIIARLKRSAEEYSVDDLFIIDQHAADEKYNFEALQQSTNIKSQKLIRPQPVDLTSVEELTVMDNIDVLKKNGFELLIQEDAAPGSGERVQLISQPISKDTIFGLEDLAELLYEIRENPGCQSLRCSKARAMFAMRACRKSVMIGMSLTTKQMISIVRNMGLMNQPWHCPHGRPTMRHLVNLHSFNIPKRNILWDKLSASGHLGNE